MKNNIVLIGFMGTGKTAVGKRVSKRLGKTFFDTDEDIEKVCGMSIGRIFNDYGEVRFRSEEHLAVKRACKLDNAVIATGGGVVLNQDNIDLLSDKGLIIALNADPQEIQKRVSKRNSYRPLLGNDKSVAKIIELLELRKPLYQKADFTIDTTGKDLEEVVNEVLQCIENYENPGN
ncbi:MAG: shikimate kinase [Bacillota bacterium]